MSYDLHPLCTLFPRLAGVEFEALKRDIQANGLRQPIILHDGLILDGGNRYRACVEIGVEPIFEQFAGGNLVAFVLSANLHRRHMTPGQQAAIVAAATDWARAFGRGGDRKSDQSATLHFDSVTDRAAQSGASERTQKMADKVVRADPELGQQVAHGEVSLPEAVRQVEGKPKPDPKPSRIGELEAEVQAMRQHMEQVQAEAQVTIKENEALSAVFESDDRLAALSDENKRLRAEVGSLRLRINGLLTEKNEAIRAAKSWQRKYEKAVKRD